MMSSGKPDLKALVFPTHEIGEKRISGLHILKDWAL